MKKLWLFLVVVAVASIPGFAQKTTGNRAPSGPHYDLNIIGVDQAKGAPLTGSNRHTIFVPLHTASSDNDLAPGTDIDRKSTRLNSSHGYISYAVFCLKKKD